MNKLALGTVQFGLDYKYFLKLSLIIAVLALNILCIFK